LKFLPNIKDTFKLVIGSPEQLFHHYILGWILPHMLGFDSFLDALPDFGIV
jgi:hypothetical protein